jgi:ribose 1,5-bisphosphokinase
VSAAEDHDSLSEAEFKTAAVDGRFAILWSAHGLRYGIPILIDSDIRSSHTVVCNVSRGVVPEVRDRYVNTTVVLVTAPAGVLAARLQHRARSTDGELAGRLRRPTATERELRPEVTIENAGAAEDAARRLLDVVTGQGLTIGL